MLHKLSCETICCFLCFRQDNCFGTATTCSCTHLNLGLLTGGLSVKGEQTKIFNTGYLWYDLKPRLKITAYISTPPPVRNRQREE